MSKLTEWTCWLMIKTGNEKGAGLAEYALLLFVVAVAAAGIIGAFGGNIINAFQGAVDELPDAPAP